MADEAGYGRGVHPWGFRRLPPCPEARWAPGASGLSEDRRTSPPGRHPFCGGGASRPRHLAFVALSLFPAGGRHLSAIMELIRLIKRLEELHTKVQGMISPPHLATTLLFNVSRRWSLYLNRCVAALTSESLDALGCQVPFLLEPILADLEGGRYIEPILPTALGDLFYRANIRGGGVGGSGGSSGGGSSGSGGGGATAIKRKSSTMGGM